MDVISILMDAGSKCCDDLGQISCVLDVGLEERPKDEALRDTEQNRRPD